MTAARIVGRRVAGVALCLLASVTARAEPVTTIVSNGPSGNRVDIAILGDGYTAAEQAKYAADANTVVQNLFAAEPYFEYAPLFNVHRIDVVSPQSGADHPERLSFVTTALDATYNCSGIQRLICVDVGKVYTILGNSVGAASRDLVIVLVNDVEYGGSGGAVAVASMHPSAVELVLHEQGHSFGLLADEYGGPPPPACNPSEPSAANATTQTIRALIKWTAWIAAATPIPTTLPTAGVPGLYQGAAYCDAGMYRPTYNSKMRSLGMPWEQVNTEQLVKRIYNWVSPIDAATPSPGTVTLVNAQQATFSVTPVGPRTHALSVTWSVDGQAVGNGTAYQLNAIDFSVGSHTLVLTVRDQTAMVRSDPAQVLSAQRSWTVSVQGTRSDLAIAKTGAPAAPATIRPGQQVTYTLTVSNAGPDAAQTVVVADPLPAWTSLVSCTAPGAMCSTNGGVVTITYPTLAVASSAQATLVAQVTPGVGSGVALTNTATVSSQGGDIQPSNNTASTTVSTPVLAPTADEDGDGLPNGYEDQFGLDPFNGDAGADPDGDGLTNAQEYAAGSHPRGFSVTALAEGATGTFFDTRLAIANPTATRALVLVRFQRSDGTVVPLYQIVQPRSRATVDAKGLPGLSAAEFSTLIESDAQVVVDRTMTWDAQAFGAHAERGIGTRTATTWYLAEGATHGAFDLFYLLQNPTATTANVQITYLLPSPAPPVVKTYTVRPGSRLTIWVDLVAELVSTDVSAIVTSTNGVPIVVERAMYATSQGRQNNAGHESAGVTSPANAWFLAEGATGTLFDMFVLIANPNAQTAQVEARYLLTNGTVVTRTYPVAANSRRTIWVDLEDPQLANASLSVAVRSTNNVPIIVERSMWWPTGPANWYEAHNSPGETVTGTKWAFAEGEVGGALDKDTYVLIANTSATSGQATVTLLLENGTTLAKTVSLAANSRTTLSVKADFPGAANQRFGGIVQSSGSPAPQIVVERAMYWSALGDFWAAGTDALATKLQ